MTVLAHSKGLLKHHDPFPAHSQQAQADAADVPAAATAPAAETLRHERLTGNGLATSDAALLRQRGETSGMPEDVDRVQGRRRAERTLAIFSGEGLTAF